METVRKVGIIGLGVVADTHVKAVGAVDQGSLAAGCDLDPERRAVLGVGPSFYTDYREMLECEQLDAVHICLPHDLHQPVAEACAAAGVNVLSEKPEAVTGEQLRRMEQLEDRYHVQVGICLQNRYNETTKQLLEMAGSGAYGRLKAVKGIVTWHRPAQYYENAPWRGSFARSGGGCMMNQSIHTLDLMQLIGGPIEAIHGTVSRWMDYPTEVEDTAGARICFANGAEGIFFATVGYGDNSSVEVEAVCERAVFNIKNYRLTIRESGGEERLVCTDRRLNGKTYYGAGHEALIREFYRKLNGETGSYVTCREGAVSVRMIHKIYESSLKHQKVQWGQGG